MNNYSMNQHEEYSVVAFDYSMLTNNERLSTLENEKKLDELYQKYQPEIGEILYNQQKILANHNEGVFQQWYESKGFKRWKVYDYINKYQYVLRNSEDPKKIDIFENMPKTLQSEMSKPSAIKEVNQAVYDGEIKTHKDYKELEKEFKQKEEQLNKRVKLQLEIINQKNDTINKQAEEVRKLKQQEPQVVRETVEKAPDDYEQLKENNAALSRELERAEYEAKTVREAYDSLLKKRQEEDEGSRKYKEMTEAINEMEGQMTRQQKRIQSQKQVYELVDKSKDLLQAITPIPYLINAEFVNENPVAKRELENIVDQTGKFLDHLNNVLKKTLIIEGEIIND